MSNAAVLSRSETSVQVLTVVGALEFKGRKLSLHDDGWLYVDSEVQAYFEPLQTKILMLLMSEPGTLWSKQQLFKALYPEGSFPEYKILDVEICYMRKKLLRASSSFSDIITTVWGRGYLIGDERARVQIESVDDLPKSHASLMRWPVSRKAILVHLVRQQKITLEQLLSHYPELTEREFRDWEADLKQGGHKALRVTRFTEKANADRRI